MQKIIVNAQIFQDINQKSFVVFGSEFLETFFKPNNFVVTQKNICQYQTNEGNIIYFTNLTVILKFSNKTFKDNYRICGNDEESISAYIIILAVSREISNDYLKLHVKVEKLKLVLSHARQEIFFHINVVNQKLLNNMLFVQLLK